MVKYQSYSCNTLEVGVTTNCPQGGDAGHGGVTVLELLDLGGTDLTVSVLKNEYGGGVRLEFGGDSECGTLIDCLEFAVYELRRQKDINHRLNRRQCDSLARS